MEPPTNDHAVREFSRLTLTLREELKFAPQTAAGELFYVIEDPINSKFHRVGIAEYTFVSLLDGKTPVADALRMVAKAAPDAALTEQEAAAICKWLVDSQLAYTPESLQSPQGAVEGPPLASQKWQQFNPISARVPLLCPDRLFDGVAKWFGWCHSPWAVAGWGLVLVYATYLVASNWDRFAASSQGVLAPGNWLAGVLSYLVLKCLHEISHGVACRRYGGSIREAGFLFILLMPIPYVDATSSWRFSSKWQRIQTAAAGMYVELFLAALALIVWDATEPGMINQVSYNVAIVGSLVTLMINANPLMRFDGYYIFSDLVEIPNLYSIGQEYVKGLARRHLLGIEASRAPWSRSRTWVIPAFGICAFVWRIFICVGLVIGASLLLHGAGIVLAGMAICLWLGVPIIRFARYLYRGDHGRRPNLVRLGATTGFGLSLFLIVMLVLPWPGAVSAPAVVEYDPLTVMRAASPGFVRELRVRGGQQVEVGEVIAVLENEQLIFELADLELAIEQSEVRCRAYRQGQKMADYQAEYEQQLALVKQREEKQTQVDQLTIRASSDGKIVGRDLGTLVGKYVADGDEILLIGNEARKQLTVSVAQEDVEAFRAYSGQAVHCRLPSVGWLSSPLSNIEPQADAELPHPALAASAGGPLTVRAKPHSSSPSGQDNKYELVSPRFAGQIEMNQAASLSLHAGQLATVMIRPFHESVGDHLYQTLARWVRQSVQARQTPET